MADGVRAGVAPVTETGVENAWTARLSTQGLTMDELSLAKGIVLKGFFPNSLVSVGDAGGFFAF